MTPDLSLTPQTCPPVDVLSEEAVLKWFTEAHLAKGKSVFLEQMKTFVEWLKNAEEGEDDDDYYYLLLLLVLIMVNLTISHLDKCTRAACVIRVLYAYD